MRSAVCRVPDGPTVRLAHGSPRHDCLLVPPMCLQARAWALPRVQAWARAHATVPAPSKVGASFAASFAQRDVRNPSLELRERSSPLRLCAATQARYASARQTVVHRYNFTDTLQVRSDTDYGSQLYSRRDVRQPINFGDAMQWMNEVQLYKSNNSTD